MPRLLQLIPRRKGEWLELVPDDGVSFRLPLHALPPGLEPGQVLEEPEWAALAARAEYFAVYERALRILGRREHFTRELERRLLERSADRELVRHVLGELRERGYLDDTRAADSVAESIASGKAMGPRLLKFELLRRGCPAELVAGLVERLATEQADTDALGRLLASKRGTWERKAAQLREKLERAGAAGGRLESQLRAQLGAAVFAWLAGRGFGGDEAREKVQRLVEELLG